MFFTGFEYRDIIHSRNKNLACFEIWTLKESYLKAVGKGLAIPLHSFRVKNMDNNQIEIVDMEKNEKVDFICKQYTIAADYKLAVCAKRAKKNDFAEYPAEICFDELRRSIGDEYCG
ncbi:4'-phosphopantetheinyl transferase superfamily protein [Virgibacillus halophilus]|uniref:4'-phosphopantetheinyl transferase superfamily protein n=1 Tax=Tigheibacillus halophilus TaxID=361280 RepID=A0ABU5C229_9BACI|nr:4'-phosphopantetheinyl transferase superfamily protein [Virgibacillus halophilus]